MKQFQRIGWTFLLALLFGATANAQTMNEVLVPKYFSARTSASAGDARTAFITGISFSGLLPSTTYSIGGGLLNTNRYTVTNPNAGSFNAAGNTYLNGTAAVNFGFDNAFVSDAIGNSPIV